MWKSELLENVCQFIEADDDDEEEVLDEEAQLMASMGLPLAFICSSDQRRLVSHFILVIWKKESGSFIWISLYLVLWQERRSNRKPVTYWEPTEEEGDEEDLQADSKGNTFK